MKVIVTGGAGFIGSNFIRYMLAQYPLDEMINVDLLTYAGNLYNLADILPHPKYRFVKADIADRASLEPLFKEGVDAVVNFAAESHDGCGITAESHCHRQGLLTVGAAFLK